MKLELKIAAMYQWHSETDRIEPYLPHQITFVFAPEQLTTKRVVSDETIGLQFFEEDF